MSDIQCFYQVKSKNHLIELQMMVIFQKKMLYRVESRISRWKNSFNLAVSLCLLKANCMHYSFSIQKKDVSYEFQEAGYTLISEQNYTY